MPLWTKCLKVRAFWLIVDAKKVARATVNARMPSWSVLHYATAAELATGRRKKFEYSWNNRLLKVNKETESKKHW